MDTTVHKRSTLHTLVLLTGELEHRRTIGVAALDTAGLLCAGDMQEADGGFEGCEAPLERSGSEPCVGSGVRLPEAHRRHEVAIVAPTAARDDGKLDVARQLRREDPPAPVM